MKTICAWCGNTITVNCNHCGAPLLATDTTSPWTFGGAMACLNGETPLIYSARAIEEMPVSHGMCRACLHLPEEEREKLILERRKADAHIPLHEDLLRLVRTSTEGQDHEEETRSASRSALSIEVHTKKGVPQGVSREPRSPGNRKGKKTT